MGDDVWPKVAWKALRTRLRGRTSEGQPHAVGAETASAQSAAFTPLIRDFVDDRIAAQDFETRYLQLVEDYPGLLDDRVSRAVNYLFCEVDALVLDERLRDPDDPHQIDEATLRMCAREALRTFLRIDGATEIDDTVESLLTASHLEDWDMRDRAAFLMAKWLPSPVIEQRLIEMLHDVDIAVQVSATESLVTRGGRSGISAVLSDFGERIDDPDTNSISTRLRELQDCGRAPILQQARAILTEGATPSVEAGIRELERLFGHLR